MKATVINNYGSPDEFMLTDVSTPVPSKKQVLIKVISTSVNPIDCKIRSGKFRIITGKKFPKILGSDFAGIVLESNIELYQKGDKVYGFKNPLKGGAYAENILVSEDELYRMPSSLSFEQAAVLPLVGSTAIQVLLHLLKMKQHSKIMINGCSGGVGHIAIQIAKYMNADMTGLCSPSNFQFVTDLGVDHAIDYANKQEFKESYFDVIFDIAGNLSFKSIKKMLSPKGKFITTRGSLGSILKSLISKRIYRIIVKPEKRTLAKLTELVDHGYIIPHIEKCFNISALNLAHSLSESGKVKGKICIQLNKKQ